MKKKSYQFQSARQRVGRIYSIQYYYSAGADVVKLPSTWNPSKRLK